MSRRTFDLTLFLLSCGFYGLSYILTISPADSVVFAGASLGMILMTGTHLFAGRL